MYGEGISKEGEIIDLGTELDIVQKAVHGILMKKNASVVKTPSSS